VKNDPAANKFRPVWLLMLVLWIATVVGGLWSMESYKATPGRVGLTPLHYSDSTAGGFSAGRPRVLMFVHPKCPCSWASMSAFAEIVARNQGRVDVEIVFVKAPGAGADWEKTSLWNAATQIGGARVRIDDGTLARQFGAETSGHVVLYDENGHLLFSGGITRSRGHEGESVGRRTICAILAGGAVGCQKTPVFGCPLFASEGCYGPSKSCRVGGNR
jgi:hypothetical protein